MPSPTFDERIADLLERLSPTEQRVARFFQSNREQVMVASAAALARQADTSDATIVRTTKALGFAGLDDMRRALAAEVRAAVSLSERLTHTLEEIGDDFAAAYEATLQIHLQSLESLRRTISLEHFEKAIQTILHGKRVVVFGLGPSSAVAHYLAIQLNRFGFDTLCLTNTGLLFADDLLRLRDSDVLIAFAYGRVYAELNVLLTETRRRQIRSLLVTDTLAAKLRRRVDLALPVPRGRADMLSMHTATLGLIEMLLVGIASQRQAQTLAHLESLNTMREKLAGATTALTVAPL